MPGVEDVEISAERRGAAKHVRNASRAWNRGHFAPCARWRGAVPMLFIKRKLNDIPRPNFDHSASRCAHPIPDLTISLTEWMCMPGRASPLFEANTCATNARRFRRFKQRIDSDVTRKPISRSFCELLPTNSSDFHVLKVGSMLQRLNHSAVGAGLRVFFKLSRCYTSAKFGIGTNTATLRCVQLSAE